MLKSSCCGADIIRKDKSGQACLYCSKCGKWIKNANKDDLRALENNRASIEIGSKEFKGNTESVFVQRGKMVNNLSSSKPVLVPVEKLVEDLETLIRCIENNIKNEDETAPLSQVDAVRKSSKVMELVRVEETLKSILAGNGLIGGYDLWAK